MVARGGWNRARVLIHLSLLCVLGLVACQSPKIRERPFSNHPAIRSAEAGHGSLGEGFGPSDEASYHRLVAEVERPGGASASRLLALADFADRQGRRQIGSEPVAALSWFRDAAVYSSFALANADEPLLQARAVDRHNRAVEELLRCSGTGPRNVDPAWRDRLDAEGIRVVTTQPNRAGLPVDELWITGDFRVRNLEHFGQDGLGVPLVAASVLSNRDGETDRFLPGQLKLPATAVVQPTGPLDHGAWRQQPVLLSLHNPIRESEIVVGNSVGTIALASDLTTPIAYQFLKAPGQEIGYGGLLRPDRLSTLPGIFMQGPYEPGKIPVLFVHGLSSSPVMWLETANALQGVPEIRDRYQFWYAYYPTGAALAFSAVRIRSELAAIREAIDPDRIDPALDQMVVVGHSLGGVLCRQMLQSSGRRLEQGLFTRPFDDVMMSFQTRQRLEQLLYFEPVPSIRRAVFIMAPHRGSNVASGLIGRVTTALVQRTREIELYRDEIIGLNGPEVFSPVFQRRPPSSIDNLEPESPILKVLAELPMDPSVPYHSVIGNLFPEAPPARWSDGVVPVASAQLDGAVSELVVRKSHFGANSPEVVAEVRRILHLHLNDQVSPTAQNGTVARHTDPARPVRR
ncbi:esterase/lipase family protein [Tautonia rosea]|uniref:esterase/lipase family protein n=1 Tax=Tautonia rosea TaxID=2728037 RepID=UPI001474F1BC|nr:hypothetical protein [Tautonia rosea]